MATVTYDDRSFLIDGKRIWLVSGSIHYFRVPAGLWRDRLLKAKRAGLNCICTYVAWNYHETEEGNWELEGEKDLAAFVRLAGELGLYVILRPGPYICSEWDSGGLPGWLAAKGVVAYRTNNASFTHYYDKYFRKVLPHLADLQVSRGGNIILIQNENEYQQTSMPDRLAYLDFISQLFRRSGFDIPIINCNLFTDPPLPDSVECVNGWASLVQLLKRMRLRQPHAPLLVTEFWDGWFDNWGCDHQQRDARETARRALEALGCGAQYNYYMWHGGTSFGFWSGRHCGGDGRYHTTSYDFDAPLAEGGGLTEKYFATRLVNLTANHMGRFFASAALEQPGVSVHDSTDVLNLTGALGNWAIVTNNGREDITTAKISLPEGETLEVSLAPFGAAAIPVELDLSESQMLDYANLTPLGLFGERLLVLHGPAGWAGRISINGKELRQEVPKGSEPVVVEHEGVLIALVNSEAAMYAWPLDDRIVFGPAFVGESAEDVVHAKGSRQHVELSFEGKLTHRKQGASAPRASIPPRLGTWKRLGVSTEPVDEDLAWESIAGPMDVDQLGRHYGYVWYRVEVEQARARKRQLYLPDCEDRATVFLNGQRLGIWGRGPGAQRTPLSAPFKRGDNVLTILQDNLGRFNYGSRVGERKGLYGPIYDAKPLRVAKFKLKAMDSFPRRLVPRQLTQLLPQLKQQQAWTAEVNIPLTKVAPIHVSFAGLPHHVAVLVNERAVGFFVCEGENFGDVTLGSELRRGRNVVRLLLWGDVSPKSLESVKFHSLVENLTDQGKWSVRTWDTPAEGALTVGKDLPAWYATHFSRPTTDEPVFVHLTGSSKGQLYLNQHNVGRFWSIGPQHDYYLPSCWMEDENELVLFDEEGNSPSRSKLVVRPCGPYRDA
jgi:beta-galactosidase